MSGMFPVAVLDDGLWFVGLALVHTLLFATADPESHRPDDPGHRADQDAILPANPSIAANFTGLLLL